MFSKKKLISILLAGVMVLGMIPAASAAGLPQLPAPTNLEWGVEYSNASTVPTQRNGVISWRSETHQSEFIIEVFNVLNPSRAVRHFNWFFPSTQQSPQLSIHGFILDLEQNGSYLSNGDYFFTVQAMGDGTQYADSPVSSSDPWTYTRPSAVLPAVSDSSLRWNGKQACFDPLNDSNVWGYQANFYFAEDASATPELVGSSWRRAEDLSRGYPELMDSVLEDFGVGLYTFQVSAIAEDILAYQSGPLSGFSPAYDLGEVSESIQDQLDSITDAYHSRPDTVDIKGSVQQLAAADRDALKAAMLADSGVGTAMTDLERLVGGSTTTEATGAIGSKIDPNKVEVVGARLNPTTGDDVKLTLGEPQQEHVLPSQYNNTVAVQFSMNLSNVQNASTQLAVPVKITMPVPDGINPSFLVILHYPAGGGAPEEIGLDRANVTTTPNGQSFVTFVLDHFSDFVITELSQGGSTPDPDPDPTPDPDPDPDPTPDPDPDPTPVPRPDPGSGSDHYVDNTRYEISVPRTQGGTVDVSPANAAAGRQVTIDVRPDAGYVVRSVTVTAANGRQLNLTRRGSSYVFTMPGSSVDIQVEFRALDPVVVQPSSSFADVAAGDWFAGAVNYMTGRQLMSGTGNGFFSPNETTSRGMIVTILYNLAGRPTAPSGSFSDVEAGTYYASAAAWASANNVVSGLGEGLFRPESPVTREQLAVILYNYAQAMGYDVSASADLSRFRDSASVSGYAQQALAWANATGLINGMDSETLNPQGSATRAQVASILMNFCEKVKP